MDPAMNKSTQLGGTGLFAKMVAKFLVKWIKKTLGLDTGRVVPALSAAPSTVDGRPERDRTRETFGEHRGSTGARANEGPAPAQALQGGGYGAHRGAAVERASTLAYDPRDVERRMANLWTHDERSRRRAALRSVEPGVLREAGLSPRQIDQAGRGRVPSGYQLCESTGPSQQPRYELAPVSQQSQHNCNCANGQIVNLQFGDVSVISLPIGGEQVTVVFGGAAVLGV